MPPAAINWCASSVALRAFAWRLNAATAGLPLTPLRSFWMYSECGILVSRQFRAALPGARTRRLAALTVFRFTASNYDEIYMQLYILSMHRNGLNTFKTLYLETSRGWLPR